jgi:hypothetical protein
MLTHQQHRTDGPRGWSHHWRTGRPITLAEHTSKWSYPTGGRQGSRNLDSSIAVTDEEEMVPRRYPVEFRRKVLDLIDAGRPGAEIAAQLGITAQTV